MKKRNKLGIFIFLFLGVSVFYPLLVMLFRVNWTDAPKIIASLGFKQALSNSLFVSVIATLISVIIAYLLAYSLNRTNIKRRAILKMFITLPMLIPSVSHGLGLINLFGANGIISRFFDFNIVGSLGIIVGSIIYSFPVAFLMLDDGFKYIDNNLYESAKVLGLSHWQTFKKVTFCYLKKPLLSSLFAVFTMIFTDYGVPLAVGGMYLTLPVFLYKEVIGLLNFSTGTIVGLFLLIPAFISFIVDHLMRDYSINEGIEREYRIEDNKIRDILFKNFTYVLILFMLVVIGSFVYYAFIDNVTLNPVFSFKHFDYVISNDIGAYLFNSLFISIFVAIFGTIITYFAAYVTARIKGNFAKTIHILTISSLAIPGIVLGLSYTISFSGSIIYNTFIILIIVNIVHFIASPYLMAYNALLKVNQNYEVVAKTCNIGFFRLIKDVILPCTKLTVREMVAYFFVNSMITISAIAFLFNTRTMPLSLLVNTYEGNMMLGEAAIISLIILTLNVIIKGIVYLINRREDRKKYYEVNS